MKKADVDEWMDAHWLFDSISANFVTFDRPQWSSVKTACNSMELGSLFIAATALVEWLCMERMWGVCGVWRVCRWCQVKNSKMINKQGETNERRLFRKHMYMHMQAYTRSTLKSANQTLSYLTAPISSYTQRAIYLMTSAFAFYLHFRSLTNNVLGVSLASTHAANCHYHIDSVLYFLFLIITLCTYIKSAYIPCRVENKYDFMYRIVRTPRCCCWYIH